MIRIGSIVIRVKDIERQKQFWTAALDYMPREDAASNGQPSQPTLTT